MVRYRMSCIGLVFFIAVLIPAYASSSRLALVIGNSKYAGDSTLDSPVYDAADMADVLKDLGFDVILKSDVDKRAMVEAIRQFGQQLQNGDVGLFYYSGHGLQSENINYLIPLQADIRGKNDIEFEAVNVNRVLGQMEEVNNRGINILILDACRNNRFKSYLKGVQDGLAEMKGFPGTFIAYATAPGKTAYAGKEGERNSIYTKHLLEVLRAMPSVNITELFINVRKRVVEEVRKLNHQQVPWESVSLMEPFRFAESPVTPTVYPSDKDSEIAQLLVACERHFQANRLTTGRGGTALECYEEVLKQDPVNAEALAGLEKIEAQYVEWAQQALDNGQVKKAQQYLERLRMVNPESTALTALEAQLPSSDAFPRSVATPAAIHETPSGSTINEKQFLWGQLTNKRLTPKRLNLPEEIYLSWSKLSPSGKSLYLFQVLKDWREDCSLVYFDMLTGKKKLLGTIECITSIAYLDEQFCVSKFEDEEKVTCFQKDEEIYPPVSNLGWMPFSIANGKILVWKISENTIVYQDSSIKLKELLSIFDGNRSISWFIPFSHPTRNIILLAAYDSEANGDGGIDRNNYYLIEFDDNFKVTKNQLVFNESETLTKRYWMFTDWTYSRMLFGESTDTNDDGKIDSQDRKNTLIKSLNIDTGEIDVVFKKKINSGVALQGHHSGLICFTERLGEEHIKLFVYDYERKALQEIIDLRGGSYSSFQFSQDWKVLVFQKATDSNGDGTIGGFEDKSQWFVVDIY